MPRSALANRDNLLPPTIFAGLSNGEFRLSGRPRTGVRLLERFLLGNLPCLSSSATR
jgi:hypothetical protein